MSDLTKKKCEPCQGGVPPLTGDELQPWMDQVDASWKLIEDDKKISRNFEFKTFMDAIAFINNVADLAESEGHHPDIHLYYNKLTIDLWTHKINGLFDNDFILAAKIDEIYS